MQSESEKVIVYLGPTLSLEEARKLLPGALYLPPIKHSDLITDFEKYRPTHVLIIDGVFSQELAVWLKEIVYVLAAGVKVYGASSMGALRAAELADYGMIGVGLIFWWFYEGVLEADDEVAVSYSVEGGVYRLHSTALVDLRAQADDSLIEQEKAKHFSDRLLVPLFHSQKAADAAELLQNFRSYEPLTDRRPAPEHITELFLAQYERDRRVEINGTDVALQHIDSYIATHSVVYAQTYWDAANRSLALAFAEYLDVQLTPEEVAMEGARFLTRHGNTTWAEAFTWMRENNLNPAQFDLLMMENARIRKLQGAMITTQLFRRRTKGVLDYLRSHNDYSYWAGLAGELEANLEGQERELTIDPSKSIVEMMKSHLEETGQTIDGEGLTDYLRECGFKSASELQIALERKTLAQENGRRNSG